MSLTGTSWDKNATGDAWRGYPSVFVYHCSHSMRHTKYTLCFLPRPKKCNTGAIKRQVSTALPPLLGHLPCKLRKHFEKLLLDVLINLAKIWLDLHLLASLSLSRKEQTFVIAHGACMLQTKSYRWTAHLKTPDRQNEAWLRTVEVFTHYH